MEASTLQAPAVRARRGASIGAPLLRLRSDEQLVALFRAGHDEAFRAIHDRYRQRLFAYTRQMLRGRQDAEDALQDVFVRAYAGLRADERHVALRAWLYRVAHNRCVDELRRPLLPPAEVFELISVPDQDPVAQAEQRESLRRLIADVRRLPDQQRSALLMRELSGMSYAELAEALDTTVPAVKSLLVRARIALARALEARDTACADIREELVLAQDRRVRPNAMARRHMRDCAGCREFRHELRGISRELAALVPVVGPLGILAKLLGFGFGSGAGGGAAVGGGSAAGGATVGAGGAVSTGGVIASAGALATGAGHVATLIVATVVTAGGAVEIQHTLAPSHAAAVHAAPARHAQDAQAPAAQLAGEYNVASVSRDDAAAVIPITSTAHVLHAAGGGPPAPAPQAKPAGASARATKASRGGAAGAAETSTAGDAAAGGSSSSTPTGTGEDPSATSTTGTGSLGSASGSSTSAGTAATPAAGSGAAGAAAAPTGTAPGASGSGSTGSPAGSPSGASAGAGGSTASGQ